jgi:hypothetical protein
MNTSKRFSVGDKVLCNGFAGVVTAVCDGQLKGMYEVRVPGGLTCVGASELAERQLVRTRWTTKGGRYQLVINEESDGTWSVREYTSETQTGGTYNLASSQAAYECCRDIRNAAYRDGVKFVRRAYVYNDGTIEEVRFD